MDTIASSSAGVSETRTLFWMEQRQRVTALADAVRRAHADATGYLVSVIGAASVRE
jgi:hypothetical protein